MSTRSQLGVYTNADDEVKDGQVFVYRHCDGYPEGVIPDIMPLLQMFAENRGIDDTEYCVARLVQRLTNLADERTKKYSTKPNCTGFGIDTAIHGDIEYFYHISPKTVKVYKTPMDSAFKDWELVETIDIAGWKPREVKV